MNESLSISLLKFTNDTMILCDGNQNNLCFLKTILRFFELASGLKTNYAKSNGMGVNLEDKEISAVSVFLACVVGQIPFKFLGVPVGASPRRVST